TYTRVLSPSGAASWDVKAPALTTSWATSQFSSGFDWSGERKYRAKNGWGVLQIRGHRTGRDLTNAEFRPMTLPSWILAGVPVFGTCWVGSNSYRAYIATGGVVHVEPMTINKGNTFQVYITWPIAN